MSHLNSMPFGFDDEDVDSDDLDVVELPDSDYCEHGKHVFEESCRTCEREFARAVGINPDIPLPERCEHGYRYDDGCSRCETELMASLDRMF